MVKRYQKLGPKNYKFRLLAKKNYLTGPAYVNNGSTVLLITEFKYN